MKRFALVTLPLLLAGGCGGKHERSRTVVLVDLGDSTLAVRDRYRKEIDNVVKACQEGDTIIIDGIAYSGRASADPVKTVFEVPGLTNPRQRDKILKARRADLNKVVDSVFHRRGLLSSGNPAKEKTELLQAVANAARYFLGSKASDKRLVLFTDGVEQSDLIDMMSSRLDVKVQQRVLADVKSKGIMQDLSGVQVWVAGATVDLSGRLSSSRATKIEAFWRLYFTRCNASMDSSRWNANLFDYPPPPSD